MGGTHVKFFVSKGTHVKIFVSMCQLRFNTTSYTAVVQQEKEVSTKSPSSSDSCPGGISAFARIMRNVAVVM